MSNKRVLDTQIQYITWKQTCVAGFESNVGIGNQIQCNLNLRKINNVQITKRCVYHQCFISFLFFSIGTDTKCTLMMQIIKLAQN
jgi:hypothetical protein